MSRAFFETEGDIKVSEVVECTRGGDIFFYIGAGFSMAAGMPNWQSLLTTLTRTLETLCPSRRELHAHVYQSIEARSFQYAASLIREYLPEDVLEAELNSLFHYEPPYEDMRHHLIGARIKSLISTPSQGIITTNYDDILENSVEFLDVYEKYSLDDIRLRVSFVGSAANSRKRIFLKLHGDLGAKKALSSEDYDEIYIRNPRCQFLLRALLMLKPIIFVGCSLEDSVLTVIRELWMHFGGRLPPVILVQSRSEGSEIRSRWLAKYAGVQTVFYDNEDGQHSEFDVLLTELTNGIQDQFRQDFGYGPDFMLRSVLADRRRIDPEHIGEINSKIVQLVREGDDGKRRYMELLELCGHTVPGLNLEDLVYRISFLINVGLLFEFEVDGSEVYLGVN